MLKDLYLIQLYKIQLFCNYYKKRLITNNDSIDHNHGSRYNVLRLPMTSKVYYVPSTKYQFLKLIRETFQLDLDRYLTPSITQFIGYFKYKIIDAYYHPVCNITGLSVKDLNLLTIYK